jgi:hypothetical protein
MVKMNRCSAWSTAITPHSRVANPGLPATRMSARTGQRRSITAWVAAETGQSNKRLPRRPAVAQDREEQQRPYDEVVAGHMGGQGGPGVGLVGRLPVGLGDPVTKEVAGQQDQKHDRHHHRPSQ